MRENRKKQRSKAIHGVSNLSCGHLRIYSGQKKLKQQHYTVAAKRYCKVILCNV